LIDYLEGGDEREGVQFLVTGNCASGNYGPPLLFVLVTGNCASGNYGPPLPFDLATPVRRCFSIWQLWSAVSLNSSPCVTADSAASFLLTCPEND
jgi:hypothetical protein